MPITVVQVAPVQTGSGSSLACTFPNPTGAGNGIVVATGSGSGVTPTSVTDTLASAYTKEVEQSQFGILVDGFYVASTAGGVTTVTATFSGASGCTILAWEVLGVITADVHNSTGSNNATQTTGAITTTGADRAVFVADHSSSSLTAVPAGYSADVLTPAYAAGYKVYTSIQTGLNPAFTASISVQYAALVMSFSSTITSAPGTTGWLPRIVRMFERPTPPGNLLSYPARLFPLFGNTPTPLPPGPGKGDETPFFRRLPAGTSQDDKRRLERVHDQLSSLLNSLIGQGIAVQLSPERWTWRGGGRVEPRSPTIVDDVTQGVVVGQVWINSLNGDLYFCWRNDANAALWRGPF